MKKILSLCLLCLLLQGIFSFALFPTTILAQSSVATSNPKPDGPPAFGLTDGTPVKLRINRTMSSADAKTGDTVDFEVLEDVKIGDAVIVPRGGTALGTVTLAKPKGRMGKAGKLNINIDSVRLVSGEKVALRAVKETKGGSHTGAMTGAIVATSIVFFPAAPFFLFMKGKDITIPKGTEITAYVSGDVSLDQNKFPSTQADPTKQTMGTEQKQNSVTPDSSTILIKSTPDGADIEIDGKFVGSTPSTLQIKFGEHKISIKKAGYVLWERTLTLDSGSNITIDAALVQSPEM